MIVMDTDVIVGLTVHLLWDRFKLFTRSTALAAIPQKQSSCGGSKCTNPMLLFNTSLDVDPSVFLTQPMLCSCLMLLDLDVMRSYNWGSETFGPIFAHRDPNGDQDLLDYIFEVYPDWFQWIPPCWMLSKCNQFYMQTSLRPLDQMVSTEAPSLPPDLPPNLLHTSVSRGQPWGMLHYNCRVHKTRKYMIQNKFYMAVWVQDFVVWRTRNWQQSICA